MHSVYDRAMPSVSYRAMPSVFDRAMPSVFDRAMSSIEQTTVFTRKKEWIEYYISSNWRKLRLKKI